MHADGSFRSAGHRVEIEKFVDRGERFCCRLPMRHASLLSRALTDLFARPVTEYSRNQEAPTPWPLSALLNSPSLAADDDDDESSEAKDCPFYRLRRFKLRHQESLRVPGQLLCSRNYFNPEWSGLRRIKNVIMVMEWAPEAPVSGGQVGQALGKGFRLLTPEEHRAAAPPLTLAREDSLRKAFLLLSGERADLGTDELANAIQAVTDTPPTSEQIEAAIVAAAAVGSAKSDCVSLAGFSELLKTRQLLPAHVGRYYVAVSLAEAETIRRVLHVRGNLPLLDGSTTTAEVALRYSPLASPGTGRAILHDCSFCVLVDRMAACSISDAASCRHVGRWRRRIRHLRRLAPQWA